MADKDAILKSYMQDRDHFADAFNYFLYGGEQVVDPNNLQELDVTSISVFYDENGAPVPVQYYRDVFKKATVMTDADATYVLLLGVENQSQQHFGMPVRNMTYDAIQYFRQIVALSKLHRLRDKAPSSDEFISGIYAEDKLIPVITLTIYFGSKPWTAARSLHEMLAIRNPALLKFIPDYKMNLIVPAEMSPEDFRKLRTELGPALNFLKNAGDLRKLEELTANDPAFQSLSWETASMLNVLSDADFVFDKTEGQVNMCKAIEDLRAEERAKGREEGREETLEEALGWLANFVKSGVLTLEQAAQQTGMTEDEFAKRTGLEP